MPIMTATYTNAASGDLNRLNQPLIFCKIPSEKAAMVRIGHCVKSCAVLSGMTVSTQEPCIEWRLKSVGGGRVLNRFALVLNRRKIKILNLSGGRLMIWEIMDVQTEAESAFWSEPLYRFYPQLDKAYAISLPFSERNEYIERTMRAVYARVRRYDQRKGGFIYSPLERL